MPAHQGSQIVDRERAPPTENRSQGILAQRMLGSRKRAEYCFESTVSVPQKSLNSLFRKSALETVFRPFPKSAFFLQELLAVHPRWAVIASERTHRVFSALASRMHNRSSLLSSHASLDKLFGLILCLMMPDME